MMEQWSWSSGTNYELFIYKIILWPLGIWPLNKGEVFSETRLGFAASIQAATFVCLILEMWKNCRGVEIILDLFVLSVFSLLACVKGLIVHRHMKKMHDNLISAMKDWCCLSNSEKNHTIMMQHARIGRLVCFSLMIPASFGTLSWIVLALPLPMFDLKNTTDPIKNFPLQTACTFDAIKTSKFYYIIFLLQMYQLIIMCLGNCGNDVFFFGLAMHICGQLKILQGDLIGMIVEKEKESKNWERMKALVGRHSHLIDLVDRLEATFNMIIFAQLIMSAILICIMGLEIIIAIKTGDMFAAVKANIVLSSLMSQLFLYCYGGDCLTRQSLFIADAIYHSLWYKASAITMRHVIFIMMRANKPIYITAGNFFDMTLSTFMDILKASVSYMSVLRIAIDV